MERLRRIFGLSLVIAKADFKQKNEGSFLGPFWYLLNPILSFALLLAIFSKRLGGDIPHYPIYLLMGIIIFNFFNEIATESTTTIRNNNIIIKSIKFPNETLVAAIVLKALFSHLFEIAILLGFLCFFQLSLLNILLYPIIIFFFCFFAFGIALLFSCIAVYFYDFDNIWIFVSRLMWIGTPIFYAVHKGELLFKLNVFNPLYYFLTISRDVLIYSKPPELWMVVGMLGYTLFFVVVGLFVFNKLKIKFADKV